MIKDGVLELTQQKTGTPQRIPLGSQAVAILEAQKLVPRRKDSGNPPGTIFDLPDNARVNVALKIWAKKAKLKKNLHFHIARHAFATLCLSRGVDLYTVSKLLGHRSLQTTQIYAELTDAKKREAIDTLPNL
jgi:integrase